MGRKNDLRRLKAKTAVCRQNDALSRHGRHAILRNSDNRSGHDVPALEWADFDRLKTIGVIAQG